METETLIVNFRTTAILALLATLLGAFILLWDRDDSLARNRLNRARRALRFEASRIDALILTSPAGKIECRRHGDVWFLVAPIAARADSARIQQILDALQELPRGEILLPPRHDENAYAHYGLDPARASIALCSGTSTNLLLIGRRTPIGDGVYVRQSDHDGIARIPATLLDLLPARADALRSRALLSGTSAAIQRLDIRNPSGYIQLARSPSTPWRILQPVATRADPVPIAALLDELLACSVVQFVQDNVADFTPYGLDPQNALTAILNTDGNDDSQMISFGDPLSTAPDLVYARLQAENSVYAVPAAAARALSLRLDDLRDRRIPGLSASTRLLRVRAESDEAVLEFHLDTNDVWQLDLPRLLPADPSAIQALLDTWANLRIIAFESPAAPSTASALPPPPPPLYTRQLLLTTQENPSTPIRLRIGPVDDPPPAATNPVPTNPVPTCRILIDDDTSPALAAPADLLTFSMDPAEYQSREVLSLPAENILSLHFSTPQFAIHLQRDPVTGEWIHPPDDLPEILAALSPLRAKEWLPLPDDLSTLPPLATLRITQTGRRTLSNTLRFYPDGLVVLRGRPLAFRLPPDSIFYRLPTPSPSTDTEAPPPALPSPTPSTPADAP